MNQTNRIEALRLYHEMPPNGLVGFPALAALTGLSRTTIWRKIRSGELPPPRKLDRSLRWSKAELDAFLAGYGREGTSNV